LAFDEYQYLIDHFNGGFPYDEVLEKQFRIANLIMSTEDKFLLFFPSDEHLRQALPMFRLVVDNGPNWKRAADAQFNIGLIHERLGDNRKAIAAYESAQQRYPGGEIATSATFRKGRCLYILSGKSPYDEHSSQVARGDLQRFVRDHPDHELAKSSTEYIAEINNRLAKMYYERAVFYDKRSKRPRAAVIAYTDFISKFPKAEAAGAARARIAELEGQLKSEVSEKPEQE
jgi:outer membrane protein assembly factor BamD (BamD/ComL family)